ncbi:hypothetical protein D0B54_10170 [Solimonas sp. K1W22B-7]|uniref:hypothetical protein n=1 Tax=Solimonas sp. K1W22B-7 TaxID=2303331 RepID=UPI000E32F6F4|nr:hypothetical protein [Solimonas sp. K1W22B-7]AXQ29029.1 hypothetical protein D0B54_10170 [Solimonas sp. K1W22B-7]
MRAIQIFNAVALATAAAFAATMGAVAIMYAVYLDAEPRLREDWAAVMTTVIVFVVLMLLSGLAFHAHRRDKSWRWPAEALLLSGIAVGGGVLYRALV